MKKRLNKCLQMNGVQAAASHANSKVNIEVFLGKLLETIFQHHNFQRERVITCLRENGICAIQYENSKVNIEVFSWKLLEMNISKSNSSERNVHYIFA